MNQSPRHCRLPPPMYWTPNPQYHTCLELSQEGEKRREEGEGRGEEGEGERGSRELCRA